MKRIPFISLTLFLFIFLLTSNTYSQDIDFYDDNWTYLPSDIEIEKTINSTYALTRGCVSGSSRIDTDLEISKYIKYHNKKLAGQYEPGEISFVEIFVYYPHILANNLQRYHLVQSHKTGKFIFKYSYFDSSNKSLSEVYNETYNYYKNSEDFAIGFAPALGNTKTESNAESNATGTDIDGIVPIDDSEDSNIPWEVIIGGAISGGAILAIRKKLKANKNKASKTKTNEKKEEVEEDEAGYILQLSAGKFDLILGEPQFLEIRVIKVTETSQKSMQAAIQIQNSETSLNIQPDNGTTPLTCQLLLQKPPQNQNFNITVTAQADGHQFQKQVQINTTGENNLVIETADNKKSLRPDTFQVLTCFAKITDEKGNAISDLTNKIKFEPKSDWIDLSQPDFVDDSALIYIGCSSPNPNQNLTPPKSVVVSIFMDDLAEGEEPLQQNLEIALVDCQLETQVEDVTFPETDEESEVSFWARIENAGEEIGWHFEGEYRNGIDPTDPLTEISIAKKTETEANFTLRGPIIKLGESENQISKTLVISAWQGDEKPLERHLTVMVSREGLFIKHGVNKNNEINFTADKAYEENLEFALNVYDEKTNQIVVDSQALKHLDFEFLSEEKEIQNLVSVLLPSIEFIDLIGNIPYGKYKFSTQAEVPGMGEIHTLKFKVKAPVQNVKDIELFEKIISINVKSYGIGSEFPDWVKAYEECQYILNNYVPKGIPYNKLSDLLEMRKMTLGAEGLKELRNRMWKVASELILAEGAEGYKSEERWANAITTTLEWTEWAGDIAFSALMAYFTGGLGGTAAGMAKGGMIDALKLYIYEPDKTLDDFWKMQTDKFVPMLMNMAKGRLLSIENIELLVKDNKPLAWTIFVSTEFLYQLYQTKSVYEAGKLTAQAMTEEVMVQKLTKKLHQEAMNRKIGYKSPNEVFDDLMKNTKQVNGETVLDQKKLLELMRDPESIRTIKNHGSPEVKKIFESARNKIYKQHDAKLKDFIKQKYGIPESDLIIDDFRTPGADSNNVNTDRDYRVLRKVTKSDGSTQYIELQRPNWVEQSYEIFGEVTGKPKELSATEWATKHQQRGTDKFDAEASSDYSDHTYNPKTGEIEVLDSNIKKVKNGEGRLISAEEMGDMYKNKVENAVKNGTIPEAYAQLQKSIHTLEEVRSGYGKQNLELPEMDAKLKTALAYAKNIKTDVAGALDPQNVKNMESQIKQMTGYDLNKMTQDIEKSFKDLKQYDKGVPK
ncbi:MAG: hypothetical protein IT220_04625 [Flavobacteriaceae bacterium]|nr:hypothetical protein [Flavobacteriaceae bacterium]